MKKYLLSLAFILLFSYAKSQKLAERWLFLYGDGAKSKTYVDTKSVTTATYMDGRSNVFILWVRTCSKPYQNEWVAQDDQKIVVDVIHNQFEFKALIKRYNGVVIDQKEYEGVDWMDAIPESNGEAFIDFCKEIINK